jgi:hypothetical protein
MQTDLFTVTSAAFRDRLLAGEAVVGSDGATWRLVHWGAAGYRHWGFARQAPGDIELAWVNSGIREHQVREQAVPDLERWLKQWGDTYRQRDQEKAAERIRVAADIERIKAAIPEGWQWQSYGLGSGSWRIAQPYVYGAPSAPSQSVYTHDLHRNPSLADRIIASMADWLTVEPAEQLDEGAPLEEAAQADTFL